MRTRMHAGSRGFTFLELLVTIAFLGVLVAIAIPAYTNYTRDARRGEAQASLEEAATRMEQYFSANSKYTITLTSLGYAAANVSSADGHYTLTAALGKKSDGSDDDTQFTVTATAGNEEFDPACTELTLNSLGVRGHKGTAESADICW